MSTEFENAVNAAKTLDELCDVLNTKSPEQGEETQAESHLMTNLPTFGGEEVDDTNNVWSWDAGRVIVQRSAGFMVVPREEAHYGEDEG